MLDALHRKLVVKDMQLMMCEIVEARQRQLALAVDDSSDDSASHSCSSCTENSFLHFGSPSESHTVSSSSSSDTSSIQSFLAIHNGFDHPT